jgi:hypothetical protein
VYGDGDRHFDRSQPADVGAILDMHYLNRDPALAQSAIRKLEKGTKTSN